MTDLTELEQVRLLIGDGDTGDELLTDDEINQLLANRTENGVANVVAAAADAAGACFAKLARRYDISEDGQSFARSQASRRYYELESTLRKRQGASTLQITSAGSSTT